MIEFERYSSETLKKYSPLISRCPYNVNDISVGSFYMWNEGVCLAFCEAFGSFMSVQDICEEPSFSYPFGGDDEKATDALIEYVREKDLPLKFYGVTDELLEKLRNSGRFPKMMFNYDRKWSDYVYDAEDIATFKGKKFGGQRNHMNKFRSLYGEPDFRPLEEKDLPAVRKMLADYAKEHPSAGYEENKEYLHTLELIDSFFGLGLVGGALFTDGKPVSVTVGEVQNDTLIIHVEKALKSYKGVYPTTFNCFVRYVRDLYPNLKTVNREDDAGDEGLRTSKLQYNPIKLVDKYLVKVNSPLYGLEKTPVLSHGGVVLSEITENDRKAYRKLCTDDELNLLWGYDYKSDTAITGEIDDDTFFDIVKFDRSIGEGISFAVRQNSVDAPLIGEVIVYNFTYNGSAEIGIRLFRSEQGKGIGSTAYRLASDWAENELKVKLKAKCFKENAVSGKMILSCGFEPDGEDETFYYFKRRR